MSELFIPRVGAVFSADIAVPQHEREVRFYARVLGTGERPLWREDLMNNLGIPIIGLGERGAEYADLPLQWMPHIQVADVAGSARRARELGGSVLMEGPGGDPAAAWAVLSDPNGAAFGVIPVAPAEAIPPVGEDAPPGSVEGMGRIAWIDLTVDDAPAARDFYQQVIGWAVREREMEEEGEPYVDYVMLGGDGSPAAGISHARGANAGVPSRWMLHLPVADLAESLRRVREEGGRVVRTLHGEDGAVMYAAVQDPVGIRLALIPAIAGSPAIPIHG
jgi:uncharacterized protein